MSEIKNIEITEFSDCGRCVHQEVCKFFKEYQDTMDDIEKIEINTMFRVECHCKQFKKLEPSIK